MKTVRTKSHLVPAKMEPRFANGEKVPKYLLPAWKWAKVAAKNSHVSQSIVTLDITRSDKNIRFPGGFVEPDKKRGGGIYVISHSNVDVVCSIVGQLGGTFHGCLICFT